MRDQILLQSLAAAVASLLLLTGCAHSLQRRDADSGLKAKASDAAWRDQESDQLRVDAQMSPEAMIRRFGPPISNFNQDPRHFYLSGHVFKAPTDAQPDRVLLEWTCGSHATDVYWTTHDAINEAAKNPPGWPGDSSR